MPCAYHIEDTNSKCQFNVQKDEFILVDNHTWCQFHASLEDKNGNRTQKGMWTPDETERFYTEISTLREETLKKQGKLDLSGIVFPGDASFQNLEFPDVDFSHAQFKGKADFLTARFKGRADFRKARFKGNAIFQHTQFIGGEAIFRNVKFKSNAEFAHARFIGGDASFNEAEFNGDLVDFEDAYFSPGSAAVFSKVKFKSSANFFNTQFSDWGAHFQNAEFIGGDVIFQGAKFYGDGIFLNAKFHSEYILFKDSFFKGAAVFECEGNKDDTDAFQGVVSFEGRAFLDEVSFNNRKFRQETSFKNCTFHKAPLFHGCSLHQDTTFTDAVFLDTKSDKAVGAYQTLKLDMEEKRARQEQLMFYALEMKSRRSAEKRKLVKFLSSLYELTSDYGQSISLPLIWLGLSFAFFAIIYAILFLAVPMVDCEKTDILVLTSRFSLEQMIRPFGALNSLLLPEFLKKVSPANLLSLRLIAALQSFLSLALLLLSALAARWRFKIG